MISSRPPRSQDAFRSSDPAGPAHRNVETRQIRGNQGEVSFQFSSPRISSFKEALRLNLREALRRKSVRTFAFVLAVTAVAKGAAFLPAYSIDDYGLALRDSPSTNMLSQGRFGQALLVQLMYLLDLEPTHARMFFVTLGLVVSSLLATLVVRHWHLEGKGWLAPVVAIFVANHPYTTEIFTFRAALGSTMISLALFALLLAPKRWSPSLVLLGATLFAIALSIYQVVLHFSLMIVLMGMALWLTRVLVVGGAQGWPARVTSLLSPRNIARHRHTALLACTVLGTIVYFAATRASAAALDIAQSERTELIRLADIWQRIYEVGEVLRLRLLSSDPLVAGIARGLLLFFLLSAVVGLLVRTRPWLRLRPQLLLATIVALIAASLIWTIGLILVLQDFWPASRVMSHSGIFWGGVLAISHRCSGPVARRGLALLSLAVVLSFIGTNNRILNDQIRLNMRDAMKTNRILARLEMQPGFPKVEFVAIDGKTWHYPLRFKTTEYDMNISAFGASWAQVAILREISGYNLKPAVNQTQKNIAAAYCQEVKPWPDPQSVAIRGDLAIVCLGPNR